MTKTGESDQVIKTIFQRKILTKVRGSEDNVAWMTQRKTTIWEGGERTKNKKKERALVSHEKFYNARKRRKKAKVLKRREK